MAYQSAINVNSKFYNTLAPTVVSDEFATTGTLTETTGGIIQSVPIPAGAYVTQVALVCTAAIGTQDLDVGDGDNTERFINAIVSASEGDIIVAPHVAGTRVAGGIVAGKYYSVGDTIDVSTDNTGSTAAGSAKLLVWYHI